jgi:hypothetical protein
MGFERSIPVTIAPSEPVWRWTSSLAVVVVTVDLLRSVTSRLNTISKCR